MYMFFFEQKTAYVMRISDWSSVVCSSDLLTGKEITALQEAGWVTVSVAPLPHIELLGIYPTWQSLLAQLTILVLLAVGFAFNIRRGRQPLPSPQGAQEVVPDAK